MGNRTTRAGMAAVGLVGAGLVAYGGLGVYRGTLVAKQAGALALFAVAVVAAYRSVAVQSSLRDASALGNSALFFAGAGTYFGGVNWHVSPAETAGQALFAIAVVYFVYRVDQL